MGGGKAEEIYPEAAAARAHAKNLPRACVLRVFTAIRVAEGAARSVAVSPYRFLCNYN